MLQMPTLPAGFIAPCLPTKAGTLPSGGLWLHEIKHDGFRVIARKDGDRVRLYSRPGNDLTYRFPTIVEALARLRSRPASSMARPSPATIMECRASTRRPENPPPANDYPPPIPARDYHPFAGVWRPRPSTCGWRGAFLASGRAVSLVPIQQESTQTADPTFAEAWYNLSDLLDEQGRSEAAIDCLRK